MSGSVITTRLSVAVQKLLFEPRMWFQTVETSGMYFFIDAERFKTSVHIYFTSLKTIFSFFTPTSKYTVKPVLYATKKNWFSRQVIA